MDVELVTKRLRIEQQLLELELVHLKQVQEAGLDDAMAVMVITLRRARLERMAHLLTRCPGQR